MSALGVLTVARHMLLAKNLASQADMLRPVMCLKKNVCGTLKSKRRNKRVGKSSLCNGEGTSVVYIQKYC